MPNPSIKLYQPLRKFRLRGWTIRLAVGYLVLFGLVALLADGLPIGFAPSQLDMTHLYQPPLQWSTYSTQQPFHWLGTDQLGRDVLANLVYGCRTALLVSFPAMTLAIVIGLLLGGIAGYLGDQGLKISRAAWFALPFPVVLGYFYGFYLRQIPIRESFQQSAASGLLSILISLLIAVLVMLVGWPLKKGLQGIKWFRIRTFFPFDSILLRVLELLAAIPNLVLILLLASLTKPSLLNLILITSLTYWTEPARLVRAELLRIRQLPYIETIRALGATEWHIVRHHAMPNALPPVLIVFIFGLARLMALESTLSFLGIGVPPDLPSWGRLVNGLRQNSEAWWLVVFPGLVLCATVLALQTCAGAYLRKLSRQ